MTLKTVFVFFLVTCLLFANSAFAQNIEDYVSVGQPDTHWVEQYELAPEDMEYDQGQEISYILVDEQFRVTDKDREKYSRFVELLKTSQGVEDNATLTLNFDPEFQTVKLHHLNIIRNGEVLDRLDLSGFQIYRYETDRYRLMYNGELELSYVIPDVRVGDILDYAYTISGKNPAFGEHIFAAYRHQYAVPVNKIHQRLSIPKDRDVLQKTFHDVRAADENYSDDYKVYSWLLEDLDTLILDGDHPSWYRVLPQTHFSSFKDWSEVGQHFAPFYAFDEESDRVKEIAAKIAAENDNKKDQVRQALAYIQREIRYLGIEIGSGGYIPRPASKTLAQRFGDCKDMTVLLIALLKELGVEAYPLLVDTRDLGMVEQYVPSYVAFDHVIVFAKVDGADYFLDPTMGEQIGKTLDVIQQGDYEKGLVISSDSEGLISVNPPRPEFYTDVIDVFTVGQAKENAHVMLEGSFTYYKGEADNMLDWYKSKSHEEIEKSFREYYQDYFPTIEHGVLSLEEFPDEAKIKFTTKYKIPNAWERDDEKKRMIFYATPQNLRSDVPIFSGAKRNEPFSLSYPVRTRHTLKFLLDDSWNLDEEEYDFSFPSFDFKKIATYDDSIYTETYTFITKEDHIKSEDFSTTMSGIKKMREDVIGISLYDDTHYGAKVSAGEDSVEDEDEDDISSIFEYIANNAEIIVGIWGVGAFFLTAVIWMFLPSNDAEYRDQLIFYPVAMKKFIPMLFLTLGVYQLHWFFKNWSWLKNVRNEKISPGLRSFFYVFTSFFLFSRFAKMEVSGYSWFRYAAFPLALLVLLGTFLGDISEENEDIPIWFDMALYIVSWIAVTIAAMQVNKMNEGNEDLIAKNSCYGWPAIGMIILFLPITTVIIWGMFLI